jgi:branched-chain amino acid transport system ATP-binding protein
MNNVLKASDLHTYYGKSHILHGVSVTVDEGEVVTVLGRNGAGKTTLLRSIMGLTPPRDGRVQLFSQDVTGSPAHKIARLGVGYVPEGRKIFGHLTVHNNLRVPAVTQGRWTIDAIYELFPRLAERRASKGSRLSGGEQEMLAIARALLLNPRFLILDEPSQGLAPVIIEDVMNTIRTMRGEGIAVLLVEQNAWLALNDADRAYVLGDGRIVYEGPAAELAADEDRVKALAGASLETSATAAVD